MKYITQLKLVWLYHTLHRDQLRIGRVGEEGEVASRVYESFSINNQ